MLAGLRKRSNSIIVKGLLFLLIASFALWGVGDMVQPAVTGGSVATVNGKEISVQKIYNDYRRELVRIRELTQGEPIEGPMAQAIASTVLDREINRTLLQVAAEEMDVAISDDVVARAIRSDEMFQEDGRFSKSRFEQIMFSNQLTEADFIEMIRGDLEREHLVSLIEAGADVPDFALTSLFSHYQEERTVRLLEVRAEDLSLENQPAEADVRAYYNENTEDFLAPEYRTLSLVHLTADDFLDTIEVDETAIEDAYSARMAEFVKPAQRSVEQMVFASEEEALEAYNGFIGGKNFEGIDLGMMTMDALPEGLGEGVFALEAGVISSPLQSDLGWHLVRVNEVIDEQARSYEDVRDQLRKELAREQSAEVLFDVSNSIEDALGGGATMEEAAEDAGLKVSVIQKVDANGLDPNGAPVNDLRVKEAVLQEAFSIDMTTEPQMRDDETGGYFMVRVDGIIEATPRPYDAVSEDIRKLLIEERKADRAKTMADQLLAAAKAGQSLSDLAQQHNLTLSEEMTFSRFESPFTQVLTEAIFKASEGETVAQETDNGYGLARVESVSSGNEEESQAVLNAVRQELVNAMIGDIHGQFVSALRARYAIDVDQGLLNAMIEQENQ